MGVQEWSHPLLAQTLAKRGARKPRSGAERQLCQSLPMTQRQLALLLLMTHHMSLQMVWPALLAASCRCDPCFVSGCGTVQVYVPMCMPFAHVHVYAVGVCVRMHVIV